MCDLCRLREAKLNGLLGVGEVEQMIARMSARKLRQRGWVRFGIFMALMPIMIAESLPAWARILAGVVAVPVLLGGARRLVMAWEIEHAIEAWRKGDLS